ncbi:TerD family protein [Thiospirillum jenense]|uniref:TerD family protein n=1 Tax=Thiospirillum jenense TaxID=1653858 RepID=UPI001EEB9211|nr:TerD family protein [Thiospirillum jenense]
MSYFNTSTVLLNKNCQLGCVTEKKCRALVWKKPTMNFPLSRLGWDSNEENNIFNNMRHYSTCIWLTGDNPTGAGDGDDKQVIIKLNGLSAEYSKVIFVVHIYQGLKNNQNYGRIKSAFIHAVDG